MLTGDIDVQADILINSEPRAFLAEFGLRTIVEGMTCAEGLTGYKTGGTVRWMTPEVLDPKKYGYTKQYHGKLPSKSTNIYVLGTTIHGGVLGPVVGVVGPGGT